LFSLAGYYFITIILLAHLQSKPFHDGGGGGSSSKKLNEGHTQAMHWLHHLSLIQLIEAAWHNWCFSSLCTLRSHTQKTESSFVLIRVKKAKIFNRFLSVLMVLDVNTMT
jgi:hypothetical protein